MARMGSRRSGPLAAWRLSSADYPILDGGGAARYGARWNSPGRFVVYAAEHFATAMLEALVHFSIGRLPRKTIAAEIVVPPEIEIKIVEPADVPGWDDADCMASRAFGDRWYDEGLAGRRPAVLLVPSAVAPHERYVLINQRHSRFGSIHARPPEPVYWDRRLLAWRDAGVKKPR